MKARRVELEMVHRLPFHLAMSLTFGCRHAEGRADARHVGHDAERCRFVAASRIVLPFQNSVRLLVRSAGSR